MSMETNCDGEHFVPADDPGRCKHGTYVGGCGWDLMCHYCESGEEPYEPTSEDLWIAFCKDWGVIQNLNRIMREEAAYPKDPEAWSSVMGDQAVAQMTVAITQALLPGTKRSLAAYHSEQETIVWLRDAARINAEYRAQFVANMLDGE